MASSSAASALLRMATSLAGFAALSAASTSRPASSATAEPDNASPPAPRKLRRARMNEDMETSWYTVTPTKCSRPLVCSLRQPRPTPGRVRQCSTAIPGTRGPGAATHSSGPAQGTGLGIAHGTWVREHGVNGFSMLSILVCHSYFLHFDRKQHERAKPYPPLATLQVAAMLRDAGHEVSRFDAMLAEDFSRFERQLDVLKPQLVLLYEDNYNFLSKMCLGRMRRAACEMLGLARARRARIIVGGSDASDAPDKYLAAGADAVLHGEALGALMALIDRLNANPSLEPAMLAQGLPDVSVSVAGGTQRHAAAARLPEPKLPAQPAWDLVDIEKYRRVWRRAHGQFSLNMASSRGCSFRCNWCAKPIWGNQYLQRPAREVAAEMIHLRRHYRPDHVWFADDIFGFRADWVNDFAAALGGDGVPFTIQMRADLVSARMTKALHAAGCREVWIGAESGSQKILDAMNKGTSVADIGKARQMLGEAGIRVAYFLQLGYLGEEL